MKVLGVLTLAAAAFMFSFAWAASATATNVVSNPGFEQGGCGACTSDIFGWELIDTSSSPCVDVDGAMAQVATEPREVQG